VLISLKFPIRQRLLLLKIHLVRLNFCCGCAALLLFAPPHRGLATLKNAFPFLDLRLLQKEGSIGLPELALDLELGSIRGAF